MSVDIPIERYAPALGAWLTRHPPTEGFHPVDVRADGDEVAVVFRWRQDPHTFLIRFAPGFLGPFAAERGAPDEAVLEGWCQDVQFWLMEELDTGHMARATRHREGDVIVLTEPARWSEPDDVWVSDVPQFSPTMRLPWRTWWRVAPRLLLARLRGRQATFSWATGGSAEDAAPGDGLTDGQGLAEVGLDPARVRALRDEGRLLAWMQATDGSGSRLGQCAVVMTDQPDVANLEVVEVVDGVDPQVRPALVDSAVRAAADAGARTVLVPDVEGGIHGVDTALC